MFNFEFNICAHSDVKVVSKFEASTLVDNVIILP